MTAIRGLLLTLISAPLCLQACNSGSSEEAIEYSAGAERSFPLSDYLELFNPNAFFATDTFGPGEEYYYRPAIQLNYTGAYANYPQAVWSVAGLNECQRRGRRAGDPPCEHLYRFRVLSVPQVEGARPRDNGHDFFESVKSLYFSDQDISIEEAVAQSGVIWRETSTENCPGLWEEIQKINSVSWAPEVDDSSQFGGYLHADTVHVQMDVFQKSASYRSVILDGTPTGWAMDLYGTLEPCLESAEADYPWEQVEQTTAETEALIEELEGSRND